MKNILQKEAKILRETAKEVPLEKIGSVEVQKVLREMKEALNSQDDGVAIAAPQIGYSMRIFVVSKKVEEIMNESKKVQPLKASSGRMTEIEGDILPPAKQKTKDLVFINPVIKKLSKEKKNVEEGCLSVRYLYGKVSRSNKATVEAYDENGKKFERGGVGLLAQIFQHETDHLNGILFIDKAKDIEDLPPPHLEKTDEK